MKKQIGEVIAHFPDETILLWVLARYGTTTLFTTTISPTANLHQ